MDGKRDAENKHFALRRRNVVGSLNHTLDHAIPLDSLSEDFPDDVLE